MQTTLEKTELLRTLQNNKEKHHAIFLEAVEGYRKAALDLLETHIENIKSGKVTFIQFYLPKPEDHTSDYTRIIKMVTQHQGNSINLTEQDYSSYVLDDWAWKNQFLTSNSAYSVTAATALQEDGEE